MAESTSTTRSDLTMEHVREAIAGVTAPWTIDELASVLDVTVADVRGYVDELVEGRTIEDVGADPRHDGDGPAPRLYGPVFTRPEDQR